MPLEEITGRRDLTYSMFHRPQSASRFMPLDEARKLGMIDVDGVEYCVKCGKPIALVETARQVGQVHKTTKVLRELARLSGLPAFLCLYEVDVVALDRQQVAPQWGDKIRESPQAYMDWLRSLRSSHTCDSR